MLIFTVQNTMNKHSKKFMSYLYLTTCLLLHRIFGNVVMLCIILWKNKRSKKYFIFLIKYNK